MEAMNKIYKSKEVNTLSKAPMKELKKEGRESKWRRDSGDFLNVFTGCAEWFCLRFSGGFVMLLANLDGWKYFKVFYVKCK